MSSPIRMDTTLPDPILMYIHDPMFTRIRTAITLLIITINVMVIMDGEGCNQETEAAGGRQHTADSLRNTVTHQRLATLDR